MACAGSRATLLEEALAEGPLSIRDHGPRGVWIEGEAASIEAIAARWAAATGAGVRLYRVDVAVDPSAVEVRLRAWVVEPSGARRPLSGVTDDDHAPSDGVAPAEIAIERLQIALEMWEQLHHEDAAVRRWPAG